MRLRHLKSSTVVVEDEGPSVLCDPWLLDGAFYGSWTHYAPLNFDTDTPVLIHDNATGFLKRTIERMGFDTIELPHGERTHLEGGLHINVEPNVDERPPHHTMSYLHA